MVMFGTKWPSITSTWMQSAPPRLDGAHGVAERQKSAEMIDGRNRVPLTGSPRARWPRRARPGSRRAGSAGARCRPARRGRDGCRPRRRGSRATRSTSAAPIAIDADQVRHHVGGAALAAVDEQRDIARPWSSAAGPLRHDDIGRVVARPHVHDARAGSGRPAAAGAARCAPTRRPAAARPARGPRAQPDLDAARRAASSSPAGGSCARIRPAGTFGSDARGLPRPSASTRAR